MTTFYLKYRPQKISELDSADVRQKLEDLLLSGKFPHAFLFAGPKGLGKTSAARIIAKSINCLAKRKKGEYEPCNKCILCQAVNRGSCLDLIEIDAASNRGIDDIRELKEKIKLVPVQAKNKIYVIDEAHMLTNEAFNALLKTLEEPPAHALFILCTTEAFKLPATIISRCLQINFHKPSIQELLRPLNRIIKAEKINIEDGVLEQIANQSEGSFRDAVKILEQLSFGSKKITLTKAAGFFQSELVKITDFWPILIKKDTVGALNWFAKANNDGFSAELIVVNILTSLRGMLIDYYQTDKVKDIKGLLLSEIKELIFYFDQAARQIKGAVIPILPLELAALEWIDKQKQSPPSGQPANVPVALETNLTSVVANWPAFLQKIKNVNHSLEAFLKAAKPIKIEDNCLIIGVFYPFHKKKLESDKCKQLAEIELKDTYKFLSKIKYVLTEKTKEVSKHV